MFHGHLVGSTVFLIAPFSCFIIAWSSVLSSLFLTFLLHFVEGLNERGPLNVVVVVLPKLFGVYFFFRHFIVLRLVLSVTHKFINLNKSAVNVWGTRKLTVQVFKRIQVYFNLRCFKY